MKLVLPHLGERSIIECLDEPGHFLWESLFGWYHCTKSEDQFIVRILSQVGIEA